ncbi:MAG: sporulation protein YtfJ [Ruminococcaceae bacterium]|nr:sporulation protein YtfJ [Oscillospiraceae bacterium]
MEKNMNSFFGVSMEKIKEMVDINTVVGDPISLPDGVTIIPVSRMSYGFGAGGSDLPNKTDRDIFAGGTGAGVSVTPVAFLVVRNGEVKLLPVNLKSGALDQAISMVPGVVDKVAGFFKKDVPTEHAASADPVSEIVL